MSGKKYILAGILLVATLFMINSVCALAVSSPYWNDYPLKVFPGETKDFQMTLKNSAGAEAVSVTAEVSQGGDIVTITDAIKTYTAPAGGEVIVNLRISVGADIPLGGSYPVMVSFKTVTSGSQGGAVGIGSAIEQKVPVVIVEKPEVPATTSVTWYLVGAVVVLLILIVVVMMRRKR